MHIYKGGFVWNVEIIAIKYSALLKSSKNAFSVHGISRKHPDERAPLYPMG